MRPWTCPAVSVQLLASSESPFLKENRFPLAAWGSHRKEGTRRRRPGCLALSSSSLPAATSLVSLGESQADFYRRSCAFIRCVSSFVPLQNIPAHKGVRRDNSRAQKTAAQWSPDISRSAGEGAPSHPGGARLGERCAPRPTQIAPPAAC